MLPQLPLFSTDCVSKRIGHKSFVFGVGRGTLSEVPRFGVGLEAHYSSGLGLVLMSARLPLEQLWYFRIYTRNQPRAQVMWTPCTGLLCIYTTCDRRTDGRT